MLGRTPTAVIDRIVAGSQVVVRDEEWLVEATQQTPSDGLKVSCVGRTSFVRDHHATFLTELDEVIPLDPAQTTLCTDDTPGFRRSRLIIEAIIRKTPVAATDSGLAVSQHQLLNNLQYQRRAVSKALEGLRPRLLIADSVGLGKTLEVGMILSELIRRGRGEKILVVTPRHILEQFQHELWTRFAIPLIRLDSQGIQRIKQRIPGNRNPFTTFKRAIISIDTLKNPGRYRHHLEGMHWDAVVIDECHNLVNRGSLNNALARVLAPRTDALLLTSATPHNGDPKSFAELIRLLDPTAVVDAENLKHSDIEHLYVRRHKSHSEVKPELGQDWASRDEPKAVYIKPTAAEAALFDELAEVWLRPGPGRKAPVSGKGSILFPWTLLKAALSSDRALSETVNNRIKRLRPMLDVAAGLTSASGKANTKSNVATQIAALESLADHCDRIERSGKKSKLERLVEELKRIGVGSRSPTRVVVFSERIATLDWLYDTLPKRLGLKPEKQIKVLHGGLTDVRQMDVINEFGLKKSPLRLLLTGDMASEGVNLHRQCHHLIHFDLPWSLITIEQRNGRIDRYGQTKSPDIRALLFEPDNADLVGDLRILKKLLEREHFAHKAFGDSASLLGLHAPKKEDEKLTKDVAQGVEIDDIVPEQPRNSFDLLNLLLGGTGLSDAALSEPPSLFDSTHQFVREALQLAYGDQLQGLEPGFDHADPTYWSIKPPDDLQRRLRDLPQSYLTEQKIVERLKVTSDRDVAVRKLDEARNATNSKWPTIGYLSPLHPVVEWAVDRVLLNVSRNEVPLIAGSVSEPIVLIQGLYSNNAGRPQIVEWLAINPRTGTADDMFDVLERAGVGPNMTNPGNIKVPPDAQQLIQQAVKHAMDELPRRREKHDEEVARLLRDPQRRLEKWKQNEMARTATSPSSGADPQVSNSADSLRRHRETPHELRRRKEFEDTRRRVERDIASLKTRPNPLVRVMAVLVPNHHNGSWQAGARKAPWGATT